MNNDKFWRFCEFRIKSSPRALVCLFQGWRRQRKKRPKISKKGRKIALLSLYLLYLYHIWKSKVEWPPRCRRPWWSHFIATFKMCKKKQQKTIQSL